jgi:hypothetical protein
MTDVAPAVPNADDLTDAEVTLRRDAPVTVAGAAVRAVAVDAGLSAERATRLRVLVEQLVTESRRRECVDGAGDVTVRTLHGAGNLHVLVHDHRLPLAPGEARGSEARRLVALGFADHLHVRSGADGNHAVCEVDIDDPESASLDGSEVLAADAAVVPSGQADALVVRGMVPADAAGLARCVYRCYGYSYVDPMMYRPRQIRRALRTGLMHSVVAVDPAGEVVGHCALTFERPGDLVPEAGRLVVDPRYRGHHLAERLAAARLAGAEDRKVVGYWVECVTNHPFSQREVIGTGGAETGLLIGAVPAQVSMQGLDDGGAGRHTLLPFAVPVTDVGPFPVHLPERHALFLAERAGALGVERDVVTRLVPADGTSAVSVDVSGTTGTAHVRVARVGADLVDRVADELDGLQAFDLAAVHLDLPLSQPATAAATTDLEQLGFAWGAWVPWFLTDGDVLRLQRVGDHPVDIEHVRCARPDGEAVRDHVVAEWHRVRHGH